jgi:hypothetical protein
MKFDLTCIITKIRMLLSQPVRNKYSAQENDQRNICYCLGVFLMCSSMKRSFLGTGIKTNGSGVVVKKLNDVLNTILFRYSVTNYKKVTEYLKLFPNNGNSDIMNIRYIVTIIDLMSSI